MSLRQRHAPSAPPAPRGGASAEATDDEAYNILPVHNLLADHPALRFPEVRGAAAALRTVGELRPPPYTRWRSDLDLIDWLAAFFGFQADNVRNQREHLILLLANSQMRIQPPPDDIDRLHASVPNKLRRKLLKNYSSWCSFMGRKSNVWISDRPLRLGPRNPRPDDVRRDLLYAALYLLIWGEAANLRFMPECLSYLFHQMAMELNRILEDYIDENTGRPANPAYMGENAFLNHVVGPLYQTVKAEAYASRNGKAPHSAWRNYDDLNEFFWDRSCFECLGWPLKRDSAFMLLPDASSAPRVAVAAPLTEEAPRVRRSKVGKTGFVEQRSFWNLFRSFDRIWVMHILFFQAALIVALEGSTFPWQGLRRRDVQARVLSVFITWAGLRLLQSVLDAGTQYSLVRGSLLLGVRMVLKSLAAAAWTVAFIVLYVRAWNQHNTDRGWSATANRMLVNYLVAALAFLAPEILALVLFIVPWVRNFMEKTNWKIFYLLTWWFQSRIFVGRGLREGVVDNISYALFWVCVLASKFSFSYFLQIKPMVNPTKAILKLNRINYTWYEFFNSGKVFAVGCLWAPVVLIYLMDIQIWYSIFSSFVGALVGLFSHLGEIRNIQQLRLRFQFFASAVQFNLVPEEPLFNTPGTLRVKFNDAIRRLKLRYGLGRPYKKLEFNQMEANRFAIIWNEIIEKFREEDIVSDREVELLEVPSLSWNARVTGWPCLLLCNELLLALSQAKELQAGDRTLWRKIGKNEYRRCAVVEAYDSSKYMLLRIVKEGTDEHSIVENLFREVDASIQVEKLTESYHMAELPEIHSKLIQLLVLINGKKPDVQKAVTILQSLYDIAIRDFPRKKRSIEQLRQDGLVPSRPSIGGLLFENAIELPDSDSHPDFYRRARRLQTILTSRDSMNNIPRNLEARRRIAFFSNSLFMNMPRAPQVERMLAFSVLTPYYDEDVIYNKEQLHIENEDGISILFYLQRIFPDEWLNFLERMRREGMKDQGELWGERVRDLRLWASYRGQTLARTVRGMMYYYKALEMLTFLDSASEMSLRDGLRDLVSAASSMPREEEESSSAVPLRRLSRESSSVSSLFKGHEYGTALMKFTYVVACQIYGAQKARKEARAEDILYLMKNHEALRVAYVDEVLAGRDEVEYYSVLVKYDRQLQREVEIYRVRLPGPVKIGEGKPENQNHALIFTRGDAVQTIDMNQDNYFEEALKMRNLLQEYTKNYGIRKPTILGVREHVFTGSVSSLAWFMSAQETSFVTLGQRVLANPLKVRMHYGHPDVFDRLWFLSRGGISKASKVINISEDIFAGFNCTLRGGNVTHHEYIQVGKGRDVGLNQISMFEAKVASGNGEQVLSRDIYRLGHRLDFFRMLSFYYTTVGFFFNTMMVVLTVYAFLWGRLYMALSGIEAAIMVDADSTNNTALGTVLNQQFIIQLGLFTALPMIIENSLEHGFLQAIWDFITMQLQLASVFYTFSMGTRTHFFGRTILHGGAKYRATGRGFVVQHKNFAENYRLYARSHFVKGIELGVVLTVYASYSVVAANTLVYIIMTLTTWFLVVSFIMSPFLFNPSGFDWLKTVYDFDDFMNWIWYTGGVFTKAEQSWETWWYEEQDHLKTTGIWGKVLEIILDLRFFFFQYGIVYHLGIAGGSKSIFVYLVSWIYVVVAVAYYVVMSYARDKYAAKEHIYYRLVQALAICLFVLVIIVLLRFTKFKFIDMLTSCLAFIPTGWGLILIAQVLRPFLQPTPVWGTVVAVARLYDILFGVIVMAPMALFSWLPGFQAMQTRILFNEAFSRGLQISRILAGKKSRVNS
ncbi:callose synthase 12 [Amborella trichopoda]|uniref:1,3-beta-glucan synthase n=1 Tax=Amborella trichopoda TaxID=13333 RepID=W1PHJ3_AMBTC|nr:callose synthase 12 [Amborella trichopoda]ERN06585.1 hypothetical protein AMTR_s00058p00146190 [Amborella trichopoda]|eukprot:XP_006844910.1 callose synthase 12 [Amborella trichopoda]